MKWPVMAGAAIGILVGFAVPNVATANPCSTGVGAAEDELLAGVSCTGPGNADGGTSPAGYGGAGKVLVTAPNNCLEGDCQLNPVVACPNPREQYYFVYVWNPATARWNLYREGCMPPPGGSIPTITADMVLRELERVGLPALAVHTNPADKTLVNLDTVFYTDSSTVTRTLTLLGQSVLLEATPTSFAWEFGDGESASTDSPGAPYPALDITHRYADADVTMQPSVDAAYSGRFRVNGGPWTDIDGTVTIDGPPADLRVVEATPVLSGNR